MLLWYIWNATLDNWTSQNICTESAMMIMMIYDGKLLDNYTSVLKNDSEGVNEGASIKIFMRWRKISKTDKKNQTRRGVKYLLRNLPK